MNKRQKKKFKKKLLSKSYYGFRMNKLSGSILRKFKERNDVDIHCIVIVDSKYLNLKHPIEIYVFPYSHFQDRERFTEESRAKCLIIVNRKLKIIQRVRYIRY